MNEKKIPYSIQAAFAASVGKDKEAHDIIGHALAEMTNGACQFAQSYSYDDLPIVVASMKVATNALESILDDKDKMLADKIYKNTDSTVINATEFMRQAKGGDGNG